MKTKKVFYLFALLSFLCTGSFVQAQSGKSKSNIETQPAWGPTGHDYAQYYYLPEADMYYNVSKSQYVYKENNRWVSRKTLPAKYKNIDLYKTYKVVINEEKPYLKNDSHKKQYNSYKSRHDQQAIRDSKETKYYANKNHPQHQNWKKEQKTKQKKQ